MRVYHVRLHPAVLAAAHGRLARGNVPVGKFAVMGHVAVEAVVMARVVLMEHAVMERVVITTVEYAVIIRNVVIGQ